MVTGGSAHEVPEVGEQSLVVTFEQVPVPVKDPLTVMGFRGIAVGADLLPEWAWWAVGIVALLGLVAVTLVGMAMLASAVARVWEKLTNKKK